MKRLLTAFALIATVLVVSCGKKNNTATTPNDCYNQGLSPAYYPNNPWNNGYNNGWYNGGYGYNNNPYQQYPYNNGYTNGGYSQWNNSNYGQFNQNNVGCLGYNQYSPYYGNGYNQVYYQGQPYYYVQQQPCQLNTSAQTCPSGYVCQRQQNMYVWSWGFDGINRQGVCMRIQ